MYKASHLGQQMSHILRWIYLCLTVPLSMQYLHHWQCVEAGCEDWAKVLLSRVVFRAWQRATSTSRREGWERQMRAKMHHTRSALFTHNLSI